VQVYPIKPTLNAPVSKSSKLKHDELLSNVAFKFNLRHYTWGIISVKGQDVVGRHTIPFKQRFLRSVASGNFPASFTRTLCQIHHILNPCYLS